MTKEKPAHLTNIVNDFLKRKGVPEENSALPPLGENKNSLTFTFAAQAIESSKPALVLRMLDDGFAFDVKEVNRDGQDLLTLAIRHAYSARPDITFKWRKWWGKEGATPEEIIEAAEKDTHIGYINGGLENSITTQNAVLWRVLIAALLEKGFDPWPSVRAPMTKEGRPGEWRPAHTPVVDPWSAACVSQNMDVAAMLLSLPGAPSPDVVANRGTGVRAKDIVYATCRRLGRQRPDVGEKIEEESENDNGINEVPWLYWATANHSPLWSVLTEAGASKNTQSFLETLPAEWSPDVVYLSSIVKQGAQVPGYKDGNPEETVDFALSFLEYTSATSQGVSDLLGNLLEKAKDHVPANKYEAYQKGFLIRVAECGTTRMFQTVMRVLKHDAENWTSCIVDRGERGTWSLATAILSRSNSAENERTGMALLRRLVKDRKKGSALADGHEILPGLTDRDLARLKWMGPVWDEVSETGVGEGLSNKNGDQHSSSGKDTKVSFGSEGQDEKDRKEFVETCIAAKKCMEKGIAANTARRWLWLSLVLATPLQRQGWSKKPPAHLVLRSGSWKTWLGMPERGFSSFERYDTKISRSELEKYFDTLLENSQNHYLSDNGSLVLSQSCGRGLMGAMEQSLGVFDPQKDLEKILSDNKPVAIPTTYEEKANVVEAWSRVPAWRMLAKMGTPGYEDERKQWQGAIREMLRNTTQGEMETMAAEVFGSQRTMRQREPFLGYFLSGYNNKSIVNKALWAVVHGVETDFWADVGMAWLQWSVTLGKERCRIGQNIFMWDNVKPSLVSTRVLVNIASGDGWRPDPVLLKNADAFAESCSDKSKPLDIKSLAKDYRERLLGRLFMKQEVAAISSEKAVNEKQKSRRLKM